MAHAMQIISPCVRPKRAQKQNIFIFHTCFDGPRRARLRQRNKRRSEKWGWEWVGGGSVPPHPPDRFFVSAVSRRFVTSFVCSLPPPPALVEEGSTRRRYQSIENRTLYRLMSTNQDSSTASATGRFGWGRRRAEQERRGEDGEEEDEEEWEEEEQEEEVAEDEEE